VDLQTKIYTTTVDGIVQSFTITYEGIIYPATLTGELQAADVPNSGGGGGSNNNNFVLQENGNLEAGTEFTRTFLASNPQGDVSDSPLLDYNTGESVDFRIADDGSLVFEGVGGPISLAFTNAGAGGIKYDAQINGGTASAVLNVSGPDAQSDFSILWYGPVDPFNQGSLIIDNKVFN